MRTLRKRDRTEASVGNSSYFSRRQSWIGQVSDAKWHDPIRVAQIPVFKQPVVPRTDAAKTELSVGTREEDPTTESRDLRGEVHRRPHSVDVHVADASVHVVTPRSHLIEAEGFQAVALGAAPGNGVHPDLGVSLTLELPDLMPLWRLNDPGRSVLECRQEPAFKRVCRLDDVVVDGNHRVALYPGLGFGQEELGVEGGHNNPRCQVSLSRANNRCSFLSAPSRSRERPRLRAIAASPGTIGGRLGTSRRNHLYRHALG